MSKDTKHTAHELRQSVLSRMDAAKKGIEELSEEELESICGGVTREQWLKSSSPGAKEGEVDSRMVYRRRNGSLRQERLTDSEYAALCAANRASLANIGKRKD